MSITATGATLTMLFIVLLILGGCALFQSHPVTVDTYCTTAHAITFANQSELDALPTDLVQQIAENNRNWKQRCLRPGT
ncbi:MAG: hypothetical protein ACRD41_04220 [Candidatus Acidiferrales bacterium]